jgi:signal transduction histidine kinase
MSYQEHQLQSKRQNYIRVVPSAYRLLAFAIAAAQIFLFSSTYHSIIPAIALAVSVGIYTLVKILHPLRWQQAGILGYSLLGVDISICIFLVLVTGGISSPFLLYTLTPVLTAALLLDGRITFSVAGLSVTYVITTHVFNPFFANQLSLSELSYLLVYMIALCLTAVLPYLINFNLRQRLKSQDILQERQRLSREIHDGIAQTVSALRWQVQLAHRRLVGMGMDLREVDELVKLSEKAHQEARESLELLRNYTGNGSLLPYLKDYLENLGQDSGIDFYLDSETSELNLPALVELELLRICQEAMANITKHSEAHSAQVKLRAVNGHVEVSITDNGRGFDALAYYRDGAKTGGHGLAVMRERAESISGHLQVVSMPGHGTEVQVKVPSNSHRSRLPWLK